MKNALIVISSILTAVVLYNHTISLPFTMINSNIKVLFDVTKNIFTKTNIKFDFQQ